MLRLEKLINRTIITSLTIDSRQVVPGSLFLAYPGVTSDGRDYITDAIAKGAALIAYESHNFTPPISRVPLIAVKNLRNHVSQLAAEFYQYPGSKLTIIGVTGTNGKTSVCHFAAQALTQLGYCCGVLGTMGNGIWPDLTKGELTTPDPVVQQQHLADFVKQGVTHVVMEVSSHALDQCRVHLPDFDIAVFTNLSRDHLDYHGTMSAYAKAKAKLFQAPNLTAAVINQESEFIETMTKNLAGNVKQINYTGEMCRPVNLLGKFNQENAAAVRGILQALQIDQREIEKALADLQPVRGRMEPIRLAKYPDIVIDYAHTPDALEKVLQALNVNKANLWIVFGCGGDRDKGKRPMMAEIAEQYADKVVVTSDNPRFEDPEKIIDDICQGFTALDKVKTFIDRQQAIKFALDNAGVKDVVLLAGKGHETTQCVRGKQIPFDERTIIAGIIREGLNNANTCRISKGHQC